MVMASGLVSPVCQNPSLTQSLEKLLFSAQVTGDLQLCGRNLKEFPQYDDRVNLVDTITADLSRNKLNDVPSECTLYPFMERLILYHNSIRNVPDTIASLRSLQFLDLSRNQLSFLPAAICQLPLQALVVNNNRLVSLPEEIGHMESLMELDASCNEIGHLPVQIGDLTSLRSLQLRRNLLQEVPIEISYLQVTTLDLSGNRISTLPVELRLMTSLTQFNLEENPLTCPPANLCSRGLVHVFKYLETQAIKEDRKRGVLTEVEYRRSYRKPQQPLTDLRFASNFSADARRKRNTTDSGYGSEQPLDVVRCSQEYTQEMLDKHTEDARRIALRAAANIGPPPKPPTRLGVPPLTSIGSTTSSGYGSLRRGIQPPSGSSSSSSPSRCSPDSPLTFSGQFNNQDPTLNIIGSCQDELDGSKTDNIREFDHRQGLCDEIISSDMCKRDEQLPLPAYTKTQPSLYTSCQFSSSPTFSPRLPLHSSRHGQPLPIPTRYTVPFPNTSTISRHYSSSQRGATQLRVATSIMSTSSTSMTTSQTMITQNMKPHLKAQTIRQDDQLRQNRNESSISALPEPHSSQKPSKFDVKTLQKEAVLSYVKSKSSISYRNQTLEAQKLLSKPSVKSITQIPLPCSTTNFVYDHKNARVSNTTTSAESHIRQLRMHIESRLRITLPEDLSAALIDGVVLCHVANFVKPRSVPTIHVPSPAVPKLTVAKCRRNVENFLLACRKIGVREDDLFEWRMDEDEEFHMDIRCVLHTLERLDQIANDDDGVIQEEDEDVTQICPNYPDLIPEAAVVAAAVSSTSYSIDHDFIKKIETTLLIAILVGTVAILYLVPQPA